MLLSICIGCIEVALWTRCDCGGEELQQGEDEREPRDLRLGVDTKEESQKINEIPQSKGLPGVEFVSGNGPYRSIDELCDGEIWWIDDDGFT